MTIEEQKTELVKLLISAYKARKARGVFLLGDDGNFERIVIGQTTLLKYGFDTKEEDFWEIICPLLKEEGFIKEYPDRFFIGLQDKLLKNHVDYKKLREELSKLDSELPPSYSFAKTFSGKSTEDFLSSVVMLGVEKDRIREIEKEIDRISNSLTEIEEKAKQDYTFIVNSKNLLLFDAGEIFKLSPEAYGVGLNLKLLWRRIRNWFK